MIFKILREAGLPDGLENFSRLIYVPNFALFYRRDQFFAGRWPNVRRYGHEFAGLGCNRLYRQRKVTIVHNTL